MTCLTPAEVDTYLDGELGDEQVDTFCRHLPGCEGCQERLERAVHLKAMALAAYPGIPLEALPPPPALPLPRPSGRVARPRWAQRTITLMGAVIVPAAAALMLVVSPGAKPGGELTQGRPRERPNLGWPSKDGPDQHAPYDPMLGPEEQQTPVQLEELVARSQQDPRAVARAYLEANELDEAEKLLLVEPESPERDCDLAVVALAKNAPAEALERTSGALGQRPRMPQAMWNRALALSGLHLSKEAAAAFREVVAAVGQSGWSKEAAERARVEEGRLGPRPEHPLDANDPRREARELREKAWAALEAGDRAQADRLLLQALRECGARAGCFD
jgi:cellulose synthase operon protein C